MCREVPKRRSLTGAIDVRGGGRFDDDVVEAIDALPGDFKEVLVLSDLGDLRYQRILEQERGSGNGR